MRYTKFHIRNFKGIEALEIDLEKSPKSNIYALVGLNESGKTTILEAINMFNQSGNGLNALGESTSIITDLNSLIPINKRDNFNDAIHIIGTYQLDDNDWDQVDKFALENTEFKKIQRQKELAWELRYVYKNSKFTKYDGKWTGLHGVLKSNLTDNFIFISDTIYEADNLKLAGYVRSLMPSILYYPNFIFDFPTRMFIESKGETKPRDKFYVDLIQDILASLGNDTNIQTHLIDRIKSKDSFDRKSLESLLSKMARKVTEVVFDAWNKVFKKSLGDTKVIINSGRDGDGLVYLEFQIETPFGSYQINERSLGFRWFFIFLLFTQFRPFRNEPSKNMIFLFDEPAANLHSGAQSQLLKSFEELTKECKIIYTTHSHHLINPHWLESTYVVKNEGFIMESPEMYGIRETNITLSPYRDFVRNHPHNTAFFQPILDVLQYRPSGLESIPDCIFLEGKNDYYTLEYFSKIILNGKFNLNLSPSTGVGNLGVLISLYLGWGKEFIVLLDSDAEAAKQKEFYIDRFGPVIEKRIFQLHDININWNGKGMEKLFSPDEVIRFQNTCYANSTAFHKTHFNRSIQENLIKRRPFDFSEKTIENISQVLSFLGSEISKYG